MRPSGCPRDYFTCDRRACVSNSDVCDLTDDCGDNSDEKNCTEYIMCDFEKKNLCSWTNSGQWGVVSPYQTIGPKRDHTTGLDYGSYVFLRGIPSSRSTLASPIFKPTNACELRIFIYIFAKSNAGEFNVYSRTASTNGDRLLLKINTSVGLSWQKRNIKITETNAFQIIIEGVKSSDNSQVIAIDDVSFDKGCVVDNSGIVLPTATMPTTTKNPCIPSGFSCVINSQCVPTTKVCDFINDCPDGSDEVNCGPCDFESSTCGWQDAGWVMSWVRKTGPSSNINGPQIDHTLQNAAGSYLLTQRNNDGSDLSALLFSPTFGALARTCTISFWIYMGDNGIPGLDVTIIINMNTQEPDGNLDNIGFIQGPTGPLWKQYTVSTGKKPAGFRIDISTFTQYSNFFDKFTEVAIDDITFIDCADDVFTCGDGTVIPNYKVCNFKNDCADNSDEKNCGTCDFESSTCGWYDADQNMKWIRNTGPSSNSYGPQVDHTLQNGAGSFMLTKTKNNEPIYYALLVSPTFGQLGRTCSALFWAHLSFTGITLYPHQLDVYVSRGNDLFGDTVYMGSVFGPTGNEWKQYNVRLGERPAGYVLDFNAFNSFSPNDNIITEIAIDDVVFQNCEFIPAPDDTFSCGDGSFISTANVCDFIRDCANGIDEMVCGNCDFENSFCNWFGLIGPGNLIWERGLAAVTNAGPNVDHTLGDGSGSYAFVNSRKGEKLDFADLVLDKNLGPSSTTCEIEFFYHMKGDTDDLILYIATNYTTDVKYALVFEYKGNAGDKWNRAIVTLGRIKESFRLVFTAERYFVDPSNDIAIDDIKLFNCEYPEGKQNLAINIF